MHAKQEAGQLLSQSGNGMFKISFLYLNSTCHWLQVFIVILTAPAVCTEKMFSFDKSSVLMKKGK